MGNSAMTDTSRAIAVDECHFHASVALYHIKQIRELPCCLINQEMMIRTLENFITNPHGGHGECVDDEDDEEEEEKDEEEATVETPGL